MTKLLISHYRNMVITCRCVLLCKRYPRRQPMLYFMHAFDWIINVPQCGLLLSGCCCRTSSSLQGAVGCQGQHLYTLQMLPTVKSVHQMEFVCSLERVVFFVFFFYPCVKSDRFNSLICVRRLRSAAWAKAKRKKYKYHLLMERN